MPSEWSQYETALLIALRSRHEPLPYQQICDEYMPGYTTAAMRGKVSWVMEIHSQLFDRSTMSWRRSMVIAWIRAQGTDHVLQANEVEELLHYGTLLLRPCDTMLIACSA